MSEDSDNGHARAEPKTKDLAIAGVTPTLRAVPAGSALFRQGSATSGLFLIKSGRIRLLRVTPDGTAVTMHLGRAGEMFAEASLFSPCYHCDAVAEEDSEVWVYAKEALAPRLNADPEALWAFCGTLARRLLAARTRLELKQTRSARERVLQFLRLRCDADGVFVPERSLKDVATEVCLTHEALYRALADLDRAGAIRRTDGKIILVMRRATAPKNSRR